MKQNTQRFSGILFAVLILIVAAVVFFEFVGPQYSDLMLLKGQAAGAQQSLANQQDIAAKLKAALASEGSEASSSQAVNLALPIGPDSAGALAQLYGLAGASGITIQNTGISLQAVQKPAAAKGAPTVASLIKPAGSLTFQIAAMGSYEALKTFLHGIETNVRLFDVTALSVKPVPVVTSGGAAINGSQDLYNYTMTITAYYQSS